MASILIQFQESFSSYSTLFIGLKKNYISTSFYDKPYSLLTYTDCLHMLLATRLTQSQLKNLK